MNNVNSHKIVVFRECPLAESEPKLDPYLRNRPNRNTVKTSDRPNFALFVRFGIRANFAVPCSFLCKKKLWKLLENFEKFASEINPRVNRRNQFINFFKRRFRMFDTGKLNWSSHRGGHWATSALRTCLPTLPRLR